MEPPAPRPAKPVRLPAPVKKDQRKVYGVVYDLVSAMTVPGAIVSVHVANRNNGLTAVTDADGFYEIDFYRTLAGDGELFVDVRRDGRLESVIEKSDPPYRERTPEMRREDLQALRDHDTPPVVLHFADDEIALPRDLIVVPPEPGARPRD